MSPRLNPFVFPSDTDARVILLIVSVLGSSLLLFSGLHEELPAVAAVRGQCQAAAAVAHPSAAIADVVARAHQLDACNAPLDHRQALWMLGGAAMVLLVSGLLSWSFPAWIIRRGGLRPLDGAEAPEIAAYLEALCREAGVPSPRFLLDDCAAAPSGMAFGRPRRSYVRLNGGLAVQFFTDRPAFRAVVFHELAHLRNGDVVKTYFTVAVTLTFLASAAVVLVVLAVLGGAGAALSDGWRVLAMAGLVALTALAVLRARETYADVRASVWDGPDGALRRVLGTLATPGGARWRHVLRPHPPPATRRRAVDDPTALLRLGFGDAAATGLAAGVALPNVERLLSALLTSGAGADGAVAGATPDSLLPAMLAFSRVGLAPLGAALLFAPLVVGVVGAGAWRGALSALARGTAPSGRFLSVGLALGLLLGQQLSLGAPTYAGAEYALAGPARLLFDLAWTALLAVSLSAFLRWLSAVAAVWLERAAARPSPRPDFRFGLLVGTGVLFLWLAYLFFLYVAILTGGRLLASVPPGPGGTLPAPGAAVVVALLGSLQSGALVSYALSPLLWGAAMAAWRPGGRPRSLSPAWAFLEPAPPAPIAPGPPLRPGLALGASVIAALAFGGAAALLWRWWFGTPAALRPSVDVLLFGTFGLAACGQGAAAALTAGRVERLGALHGLMAAFVAGWLMAGVGWLVAARFGVRLDDAGSALASAAGVTVGGYLAALPAALVAGAVARRRRAAPLVGGVAAR